MTKIKLNKQISQKLGIFPVVVILFFSNFFLIKTKQGAVAKEKEKYKWM